MVAFTILTATKHICIHNAVTSLAMHLAHGSQLVNMSIKEQSCIQKIWQEKACVGCAVILQHAVSS